MTASELMSLVLEVTEKLWNKKVNDAKEIILTNCFKENISPINEKDFFLICQSFEKMCNHLDRENIIKERHTNLGTIQEKFLTELKNLDKLIPNYEYLKYELQKQVEEVKFEILQINEELMNASEPLSWSEAGKIVEVFEKIFKIEFDDLGEKNKEISWIEGFYEKKISKN